MKTSRYVPEALRGRIERENEECIRIFRYYIRNLKPFSRNRHEENIRFFLNDYLLNYEGGKRMEEGPAYMDGFFNYFYVRKGRFTTPEDIRHMAATLKKFYAAMDRQQRISHRELERVRRLIRTEMPQWQSSCATVNGIPWPQEKRAKGAGVSEPEPGADAPEEPESGEIVR